MGTHHGLTLIYAGGGSERDRQRGTRGRLWPCVGPIRRLRISDAHRRTEPSMHMHSPMGPRGCVARLLFI